MSERRVAGSERRRSPLAWRRLLVTPRTFSTAPRIPSGCSHCPFLMFTAFPVAPAASSRSVWRQRNAGICKTSATWATAAHWSGRCTSVSTGSPDACFTRSSARRPSSMPGPRWAPWFERLALSKLALNTIPPGNFSASCASRSATFRLSVSSSRTQGPAMTKSASSRKMLTSVACLREGRRRLAPLSLGAHRGRDEAREEGMRSRGAGLELGVELAADEPRVLRVFDDLDELSVGTQPAQAQAVLGEEVAILVRDFIAMPMALTDLRHAIHLGRLRIARETRRVGAKSHRAAHVRDVLL